MADDENLGWMQRQIRPQWDPPANPAEAGERAFNLACGEDVRDGWIDVDLYCDEADEAWDLLDVPWPVADDAADRVLMDQFLEHVPPMIEGHDGERQDGALVVLRELGRILRPGGRAYVGVPYAGSHADVHNICHYRRFNEGSLDFLRPDPGGHQAHQEDVALRLEHVQVIRYWTNLLGEIHTAYHIGRRIPFWPNVGPKQQVGFVLSGREEASPASRAASKAGARFPKTSSVIDVEYGADAPSNSHKVPRREQEAGSRRRRDTR